MGAIQELGSTQEGSGKVGTVEYSLEKVRALQMSTGQVRPRASSPLVRRVDYPQQGLADWLHPGKSGASSSGVDGLTTFFLRGLPRAALVLSQTTGRGDGREVKLDPEERIIAAALDEPEPDSPKKGGARARIEFMPEGHAKVTITISRELVEEARTLDLTTWELFAEALQLAIPGAFELARPLSPRLH